MEEKLSKTYKIFKTKNGYKLNWFASRPTKSTGGVGLIDDNGSSKAVESTVRVKGTCECSLILNEKFGVDERNLIKMAMHSALYALDLEEFLYNAEKRNDFINYVLKDKINVVQIEITNAWIQTDISKFDQTNGEIALTPYKKRYLIEDGKKIEDLVDENHGRKYAFYTDIEIIDEEDK